MSKKTEQKTCVPKLRFPEFQDAGKWEEKPLGKVAKVLQGSGFPTQYQGNINAEYPFYKVSDISNSIQKGENHIKEAANYIDEAIREKLKARLIPVGTTIFAKIGEAIRLNRRVITTEPCLIDNNVAGLKRIKSEAIDLFIYYTMLRINLADHCGGAVPSVNKTTLENILIVCPEIPEQERIADCLSSLDDVITAQGRKVEALKDHKKGLMQQLFPAEGQTRPATRFPEFRDAGDWEEKPLNEVIQTVTPPKKIQTAQYMDSGTFPIIDQSQNQIAGWTNDNEAIIDKGLPLIIFGDHTCILKIINEPFAQGADGIKIFSGTSEIDTEFLYQCLQSNPLKMEEYKRHFSILKEKAVLYPKKETGEQQKIADFLSSLDDVIAAQGRKVEALEDHKKGLMQQLFPAADDMD